MQHTFRSTWRHQREQTKRRRELLQASIMVLPALIVLALMFSSMPWHN